MKTHFPTSRLTELVKRSGGICRDEAVAAVTASLEGERSAADREIVRCVTAMERVLSAAALSTPNIVEIMRHADQIVTLAGMFGYTALDAAARSLCDIADGLVRAEQQDRAPLAVHIQTLRLLAPGSADLGPDHTALLLGQLAKVTEHFNFGSLDARHDVPDVSAAAF